MENLFQHIIPVNEGYDYLFSDLVYVPIYETSLLVTKRTIMPISLVEEKVLQLIDVGVYQIDEIAQILGLKRKLLDVTLADLYSKNLGRKPIFRCPFPELYILQTRFRWK